MTSIKRILLWVYNVYGILLFVALMFMVFPFVLLVSIFDNTRGGNLIYRLCMLWADCWFPLVGIFHRNYFESPHNPSKSYLFVTNHISFLDAAIIVKAFRKPLRPLGRKETAKIPVFGYIYKKAIVTVDRGNAEDRNKSVRLLKAVLQKGISILLFPEGTFNETGQPLKSFYDGAFKIAIETQTPIKPVLFLDAYDRMPYHTVLSLTPGKSRAIYMQEISVDGLTMEDVESLKQKVFHAMSERLRFYGASWIKDQQP